MLHFKITGMTCDHCVRAVTEAVQRADPSAEVAVDLAAGRATIRGESVEPGRIAAAIAGEGYVADLEP